MRFAFFIVHKERGQCYSSVASCTLIELNNHRHHNGMPVPINSNMQQVYSSTTTILSNELSICGHPSPTEAEVSLRMSAQLAQSPGPSFK